MLGVIIHSDGWGAYKAIKDIPGKNYTHKSVNHSKNFKNPEDGTHTNTIEGAWYSKLKRHIPNNAYNMHALQDYLFVQMWKEMYKENLWKGFWKMVDGLRVTDDDGIYWVDEHKDDPAYMSSEDETETESEEEETDEDENSM